MQKRILLGFLLVAAGLFSSCAPMEISSKFDPNQAEFINRQGSATVIGQAFLRQRGGGIVTCAGSGAALIPATDYATELFTNAFGNREGGVAGFFVMAPQNMPSDFLKYSRKSSCDVSGSFSFAGVPAGSYYLISQVTWYVGGSIVPEGGVVGRRIQVRNGVTQNVIVSG